MSEEWKLLAAFFSGSMFSYVVGTCLTYFWRPILEIRFAASEAGCVVDTPANYTANNVTAIGEQRVLRLKIYNAGLTTAKNVTASVQHISYYPTTGGANRMWSDEVLDLNYAMGALTQIDIPSKGHRFVDLFFVDQPGMQVIPRFGFKSIPSRFLLLPFAEGSYSAFVFVSASTAYSKTKHVNWHWDGHARAGCEIVT